MAPSRRAPARSGASLVPLYQPAAPPRAQIAASVADLSLRTVALLEALFLAQLPRGLLNNVPADEKADLLAACPDLDQTLLRRWWTARQWEQRRKVKQARAEVSADQDGPSAQVSNESAGPPRANEGLGQLVTPKKHNPSTPAKASLSGSPPPSIRAELDLVSPVPRDLKDSPPRQRRCTSRPVIRLHTQPQSNPTAQSVQQPVGWPDEVEPLACSPRSRSTTTTAVADLVQEGKESDRTSISRAELMARMQGLVNGRAEAETERAEFSIDDVYELSRLGVNETEDRLVFFCCTKLIIGSWIRVLDIRDPELMLYFTPSTSSFQAWTAYNNSFYRISLPIPCITGIKIFHDPGTDEACILFTRSLLARPGISFAISHPMTLKWERTLHDFTQRNEASRRELWATVTKGAGAAVNAIKEIAASEVEQAEGDLEAGERFLGKVWWGTWDSEKTTVEDLIACMDAEPVSVEYDSKSQGGQKWPRREPRITSMEYEHPRHEEERIWCRAFLQDDFDEEESKELDENSVPGGSNQIPPRPQAHDYRCPWLNGDQDRRVLSPWPNPTFPPPTTAQDVDSWNPTLAKCFSPSPEKSSSSSPHPTYHYLDPSTTARLSRVSSSASKAFLGHSYSSPPSTTLREAEQAHKEAGECYLDSLYTAFTLYK